MIEIIREVYDPESQDIPAYTTNGRPRARKTEPDAPCPYNSGVYCRDCGEKCEHCGWNAGSRAEQKQEVKMNIEKNNQAAKADGGKVRPWLVPPSLVVAVAHIREYGCQKYNAPDNWKQVEPERYWNALYRHLLALLDGERTDKESGLPHLWHIACNVAFLIEMEEKPEW